MERNERSTTQLLSDFGLGSFGLPCGQAGRFTRDGKKFDASASSATKKERDSKTLSGNNELLAVGQYPSSLLFVIC